MFKNSEDYSLWHLSQDLLLSSHTQFCVLKAVLEAGAAKKTSALSFQLPKQGADSTPGG